LERVLKQQQ
jgi:hypothetical protein